MTLQPTTYNLQPQKGFTLIELIIVVALFSVISIVLTSLFIGHNRIYRTQTAELDVTGDARTALDDIDSYVRQANRALATYSTYTATGQVLILQIQSVNSSNQLVAGKFDHVVYYLSGNGLFRRVFPDASSVRAGGIKKLANNVNGLTFTPNNANYALVTEVTTDITVQENAGVQNRAITASSKASLRAY